jgi:hypothetical protein
MTTTRRTNPLDATPPIGQEPADYDFQKPDLVLTGFPGRGSGILLGVAVSSSSTAANSM